MTLNDESIFTDTKVVESKQPTVATSSSMDDLDKYLAGYTQKMDVPLSSPPNTQPTPQGSGFAIGHDPNGSKPVQEYYVRGAKKGQPKPPSKSKPVVQPPTQIQASVIISGALFITLVDTLMPMVICGLNNWLTKTKVDPDKMKMTESQRRDLVPIGDAVVKELNIQSSPSVLFLVSLVGIYGINFMSLRSQAETKLKKENEKTTSKPAQNNAGQNSNTPAY